MVEHVIFIIDISASVEKYKDTYLNTINNIIEYQRKLFPQSHITIATFNHNHDFYCINQKVVNNFQFDFKIKNPSKFRGIFL